jgi:phosphoribosylformylglycinamidine (FGAM) synthase-like enzyme
MAIAGGLGARLELGAVPFAGDGLPATARDLANAFSETPGRFVCAVAPADADGFAARMAGVPWAWIGAVTAEPIVEIVGVAGAVERVPLARLAAAWHTPAGGDA